MRSPPLAFVLSLAGCGSLSANGVDPGTDCAAEDSGCVTLEPAGDDDDVIPLPDGAEQCLNGVDDDDDGDVDCDDDDCAPRCDSDGDGAITLELGGTDCDDDDGAVHPAADEVCDGIDNDCRAGIDGDVDGDGVAICDDCDEQDPTVYPGASDTCGDGFDSDCDGGDCLGWTHDFESAAGPEWATSGPAAWNLHTASSQAFEGGFSAQSGDIANNQTTRASIDVTFTSSGTVSFWHTGSTEANYDYLQFYVDGALQEQWAGTWGWTHSTYAAPVGAYTFEWVYLKDVSIDGGTDTVWIDLVEITGGSP